MAEKTLKLDELDFLLKMLPKLAETRIPRFRPEGYQYESYVDGVQEGMLYMLVYLYGPEEVFKRLPKGYDEYKRIHEKYSNTGVDKNK